MKNLRYVLLGVGLTLVLGIALGYAVTWAQGSGGTDEVAPGRYQMVNLAVVGGTGSFYSPSPSTIVLLDTYTGRTWALKAGTGAYEETNREKKPKPRGTYLREGWTLMPRRDEVTTGD